MTIKTVKMSSDHQVYLPDEVLKASGTEEGQSFLIRVRGRIIELVPVDLAEKALEEGLANLQEASPDHLTDAWDNPEDEAWDEA